MVEEPEITNIINEINEVYPGPVKSVFINNARDMIATIKDTKHIAVAIR
jgi:hypothetical protein